MKPIVLNAAGALALTFTIAACVPSSNAPRTPAATPPRPTPAPVPAPAPPPRATNWMDAPATPGDWSYEILPLGGVAQFGNAQSGSHFEIVCNRAERQIYLKRSGKSSTAVSMVIRTEFGDRTFAVTPMDASRQELVASLSPSDSFLDAMALTKGRFAVEIAGLSPLYLPSWGEVTRVIEDCR